MVICQWLQGSCQRLLNDINAEGGGALLDSPGYGFAFKAVQHTAYHCIRLFKLPLSVPRMGRGQESHHHYIDMYQTKRAVFRGGGGHVTL